MPVYCTLASLKINCRSMNCLSTFCICTCDSCRYNYVRVGLSHGRKSMQKHSNLNVPILSGNEMPNNEKQIIDSFYELYYRK